MRNLKSDAKIQIDQIARNNPSLSKSIVKPNGNVDFWAIGVGPNVWFKAQPNGNELLLTREDGKPNRVEWVWGGDPHSVFMAWEIRKFSYEERNGFKYLVMDHDVTIHGCTNNGVNVDFEFFGIDKQARLWFERWPDADFSPDYAKVKQLRIIARTDFTQFTKNLHFSAGGGLWSS